MPFEINLFKKPYSYRYIKDDKMPTEINFYKKNEENEWLSNFYESPQTIDGITYPTNEHYYQSQKSKDPKTREWIASSSTPREAKNRGNSCTLRDDWDTYKIEVMYNGLRAKFKNPELRQKLLDTGDAILHEDSPTDMVWGKLGKDLLGKLIMAVRDEIKIEILNEHMKKTILIIEKIKQDIGLATEKSYTEMWEKIDGMTIEELHENLIRISKLPYRPKDLWAYGITIGKWVEEIKLEIARRE